MKAYVDKEARRAFSKFGVELRSAEEVRVVKGDRVLPVWFVDGVFGENWGTEDAPLCSISCRVLFDLGPFRFVPGQRVTLEVGAARVECKIAGMSMHVWHELRSSGCPEPIGNANDADRPVIVIAPE